MESPPGCALAIACRRHLAALALVVTNTESWLQGVAVKERGLAVASEVAAAGPQAEPGAIVPAFRLVNQDGRSIDLGQYRGLILTMTFIYTRCPIPEFCPFLMKRFRDLEADLAKDPDLYEKTHLLSVTFDPAFDTPSVLRRFGLGFVMDRGKGPFEHWELATGTAPQIKEVAGFFGLQYAGEGASITHSLRTAIIGPKGEVIRVFEDNNWTIEEAVAAIRSAD